MKSTSAIALDKLEKEFFPQSLYEPKLKTKDAARVIGMSAAFLHKDRARKPAPLIPYIKIGTAIRYSIRVLQEFVERNASNHSA